MTDPTPTTPPPAAADAKMLDELERLQAKVNSYADRDGNVLVSDITNFAIAIGERDKIAHKMFPSLIATIRTLTEENRRLREEYNESEERRCIAACALAELQGEVVPLREVVGIPEDVRSILAAFAGARLHGQQKYGGHDPVAHDLQHTPKEWLLFVRSHLERAQAWGVWTEDGLDHLVKAGGLILSAIWCAEQRALTAAERKADAKGGES